MVEYEEFNRPERKEREAWDFNTKDTKRSGIRGLIQCIAIRPKMLGPSGFAFLEFFTARYSIDLSGLGG